ncbi:MAG: DJ-1/PfpI family protein [Clostridia bacterium]|nr:DJ-1/PfpI family protein [Clostridia bacterium]
MIYVFLADGFEECEALAPVDILRRANIEVKTVGIGSKTISGSHNIKVLCDISENEAQTDNLEGIILPGGMPGTLNLEKSDTVQEFLDYSYKSGLLISAICAAPSILGHKGLLKNKKACCFKGFEKDLTDAFVTENRVEADGNIITAYGAGAAFDFGFKILEFLKDYETANALKEQMRY